MRSIYDELDSAEKTLSSLETTEQRDAVRLLLYVSRTMAKSLKWYAQAKDRQRIVDGGFKARRILNLYNDEMYLNHRKALEENDNG